MGITFSTSTDSFIDVKKDGTETIVFITRLHNSIDVIQTVLRQEICAETKQKLSEKILCININ